jgi:hypothetical protein
VYKGRSFEGVLEGRKEGRKDYIQKLASMAEEDEMGNTPNPSLGEKCP